MFWHLLVFGIGLTWLIEWAVAAVILRRSDGAIALCVLLINTLTQPLAGAAFYEAGWSFWVIEPVVCLVEIPLYRVLLRVSWGQAALISLVGNVLTAAVSFLF
jgi:hypothetical protein